MGIITIENDRLRLSVDHERGGNVLGLWLRRGQELVPIIGRGIAGEDPRAKPPSFLMAPWTNRIRDGVMHFGGKAHQLRITTSDDTKCAIHGDVRSRPWDVLDRSPVSARLGFDSRRHEGVNFPFAFACEVRYELSDSAMRMDMSVRNVGTEPMPAGVGIHPYFPRNPTGLDERVRVQVACAGRYPCERCMATGPMTRDELTEHFATMRELPEREVNDVFGGFGGRARIEWPVSKVRVEMSASAELGHMVIFAPRKKDGSAEPFFAIEPLSMVNDGINLLAKGWRDTGVRVLGPGEKLAAWCEMKVE
jgi:aldose 1-epimerase